MLTPSSLNAYARHRKELGLPGGTLHAVQVAIEAGRLKKSVTKARKISNMEAADAEWKANTRADYVPLSGPAATKGTTADGDGEPSSLGEARARLDEAKARIAELDLAERLGELVPAADVEARLVAAITQAKTKLLGVPSRARQQDPGLTVAQLALLDLLIREACEDLAEGK